MLLPEYDFSRFSEYMNEEDYQKAYKAMTGGLTDDDIVIRRGAQITEAYHNTNPMKFADVWERTKALMERHNA